MDVSELLTYTKSKPYPAISVIIPAYNAESTIIETLESVFAQTFTDFEVIVIDDGSTDNTVAVIKELQDDRLKVFCYPNAGQGESRNRGACHATGEFFAFLDSDDLWRADKLESQYQAIINWTPPVDAEAVYQTRQPAVSYSWVDWVDISGKFIQRGCDYTTNGYVYPQLLLSDFIAGGSNAMIWRGAFYQLRGGLILTFPRLKIAICGYDWRRGFILLPLRNPCYAIARFLPPNRPMSLVWSDRSCES